VRRGRHERICKSDTCYVMSAKGYVNCKIAVACKISVKNLLLFTVLDCFCYVYKRTLKVAVTCVIVYCKLICKVCKGEARARQV
jgi:hypothetical protein